MYTRPGAAAAPMICLFTFVKYKQVCAYVTQVLLFKLCLNAS